MKQVSPGVWIHKYYKDLSEALAFLNSLIPKRQPEMPKLATMTETQERYIRSTERCPVCIPHEGRAEPMRLLGDFGPMRGYQCKRCNNVWCISAPNKD